MLGKIQFGEAKQAYHKGSSRYAWMFPGEFDESTPYWLMREVESGKIKRQEDGSYKIKNIPLKKGYVFVYDTIKRRLTFSDENIFSTYYFVYDEKDDEVAKVEVKSDEDDNKNKSGGDSVSDEMVQDSVSEGV